MNRLSAKVAIKRLVRRLRDSDAGDARQRAEKMWATLHERKPGWEHVYQSSWQWPHRTAVVDAVRSLGPHGSILELGCNAGQNIIALHKGVGDAAPLQAPLPHHGYRHQPRGARIGP